MLKLTRPGTKAYKRERDVVLTLFDCGFTEGDIAECEGIPLRRAHSQIGQARLSGYRVSPQTYCALREEFGFTKIKKFAHPDYPEHFATKDGKVYFKDGELYGWKGKKGYIVIKLYSKPMKQHRFICTVFHGRPKPGQQVCHLDGVRTNNKPSNLRWGSNAKNSLDRCRHLKALKKLQPRDVYEIRRLLEEGKSGRDIAKAFNVDETTVSKIKHSEIWGWLK